MASAVDISKPLRSVLITDLQHVEMSVIKFEINISLFVFTPAVIKKHLRLQKHQWSWTQMKKEKQAPMVHIYMYIRWVTMVTRYGDYTPAVITVFVQLLLTLCQSGSWISSFVRTEVMIAFHKLTSLYRSKTTTSYFSVHWPKAFAAGFQSKRKHVWHVHRKPEMNSS